MRKVEQTLIECWCRYIRGRRRQLKRDAANSKYTDLNHSLTKNRLTRGKVGDSEESGSSGEEDERHEPDLRCFESSGSSSPRELFLYVMNKKHELASDLRHFFL